MNTWRQAKRLAFGDLWRAFMDLHADVQAASARSLLLGGIQAAIAPRGLVICEYDGIYGDMMPVVTPYKADFARH